MRQTYQATPTALQSDIAAILDLVSLLTTTLTPLVLHRRALVFNEMCDIDLGGISCACLGDCWLLSTELILLAKSNMPW